MMADAVAGRGDGAPVVLIVDDEPSILFALERALRQLLPVQCLTCSDARQMMAILRERQVDLLLLDLVMPHIDGKTLLDQLGTTYPELPTIVVTGMGDIDTAVSCMRLGAVDFIVKPVRADLLGVAVRRVLERRELAEENRKLRDHLLSPEVQNRRPFRKILTASPAMVTIFNYIDSVARSAQPVLITGETGVGKELVAEALHESSGRGGPFVALNVAGLDESAFSDTLFGHRRGAFTGAIEPRDGLIEKASGGTLLLDEIGDLSMALQVKLLRLLQNREYFRLGEDCPRSMSARIVLATNQDLGDLQQEGRFRPDLYYRLRAHHVHIPPLRDRPDDIALLARHFCEKAARALGVRAPTIPPDVLDCLQRYAFPGNVRELEAMMADAVACQRNGAITRTALRVDPEVLAPGRAPRPVVSFGEILPSPQQAVDLLVAEALRRSGGNQSAAARLLRVSRQAINQRVKCH